MKASYYLINRNETAEFLGPYGSYNEALEFATRYVRENLSDSFGVLRLVASISAKPIEVLVEPVREENAPDPDGWIPHTGDTCPCDPDDLIHVILRCGTTTGNGAVRAGSMHWGECGNGTVAEWKLAEPEEQP